MKHDPSLKKLNMQGFVTRVTSEIKKKRNMFHNKTIRLTWNRDVNAVPLG